MKRLFVISDHHFYHHNIIGYTERPFESIDEMHSVMIQKWNDVISPDDVVLHNGDFHLAKISRGKKGPTKEQAEMLDFDRTLQVVSALNGTKWLIKGNHDLHSNDFYFRCGFTKVKEDGLHLFDEWAFSHRPLFEARYQNQKAPLQIDKWFHGHIHNKISAEAKPNFHINVSVEVLDYTPLLISENQDKITKMDRFF